MQPIVEDRRNKNKHNRLCYAFDDRREGRREIEQREEERGKPKKARVKRKKKEEREERGQQGKKSEGRKK